MATAVTKRKKQTLSNEQIVASFSSDEIAFHRWLRSDPVAFCKHALQFTPHRAQAEVLTSPLERQRSLLAWGRQGGKSEIVLNFLCWRLFSTPRYLAYWMAPSGEQSEDVLHRLIQKFEQSEYLSRYATWALKGRTLIVGGDKFDSRFEFLKTGLTAENVRGRTSRGADKTIVVWDEVASFLYPETIVGTTEYFVAAGGGEVYLSSPGEPDSYYHKLYLDFREQEALALAEGRTPRHRVYESNWRDWHHLSAEFVEEKRRKAIKENRLWWFQREMEGQWVPTEGAFFNPADVKQCQSPTTLTGGSGDCWIFSLDPALDRAASCLLIARWSPLNRRLEIVECLVLVRQGNKYVDPDSGAEFIDGYPDLLDLILERRRERPIHRFYVDPATEKNIGETLRNRFAVNVVDVRIGGYAAKCTALADLQRALAEKRIVWEDGRITRQLLDFAPPTDPVTGRYEFPDSNYDIIAALTQLCRYLGDRVETPFLFETGGVRAAW